LIATYSPLDTHVFPVLPSLADNCRRAHGIMQEVLDRTSGKVSRNLYV
jgi:hypothetical protein